MNKKTPLLDMYKEWLEAGKLPEEGLCKCIKSKAHEELLDLFNPSFNERVELAQVGFSSMFWGSGLMVSDDHFQIWYSFTPMRQTILLFMAAMNNEL